MITVRSLTKQTYGVQFTFDGGRIICQVEVLDTGTDAELAQLAKQRATSGLQAFIAALARD